jgi:hypothetical protein
MEMSPITKFGIPAVFLLVASSASADFVTSAAEVISFTRGPGTTHPNFFDPANVLGAPDYADPGNSGFGTGATALGQGGVLVLRMSAAFTISNSSSADLVIHEIGPAEGGTAEGTKVEISKNGVDWLIAGMAPGGVSGLDLDVLGFSSNDLFSFVRLTDITFIAGQPAGADIDAVVAVTAVPLPNGLLLGASGLFIIAGQAFRRKSEA